MAQAMRFSGQTTRDKKRQRRISRIRDPRLRLCEMLRETGRETPRAFERATLAIQNLSRLLAALPSAAHVD